MTFNIIRFLVAVLVLGLASVIAQTPDPKVGVIILAHGGKANWNEEVMKVRAEVDKVYPAEVALGMASRKTIQAAADKLAARGVERIVAVPLFISSHSTVITSTEYLLGKRADAPADLAKFAKMDHGSDGGGHGSHGGGHSSHSTYDGTKPIETKLPVVMTRALDDHPKVAEILTARAKSLGGSPANEVVIVVAHGPVTDESNRKWLADMSSLVATIKKETAFKRIEYMTVRDDAPEPIRSQATAELRAIVEKAKAENADVLIVPLLLSFGGIEEGVKKRLEGLTYKMSPQGLLPDPLLAQWVLLSVAKANERIGNRRSTPRNQYT
jgi:sirohydrochlorin cobaltochelatase